jgi:hypothetical protein
MLGFLIICAISCVALSLATLVTYEVLRVVWRLLPKLSMAPRLRVLFMMAPMFLIHITNIWLFGLMYFLLENQKNMGHLTGSIRPAEMSYESFIERLYFSASTYASLGLGDIYPAGDLRMLASAEVLCGLLMIGWTVSFTYLVMENFWSLQQRRGKMEE